MSRRDLTGAVDFSVLDQTVAGDQAIADEVLGLFQQQAEMWRPLLSSDNEGWRDAVHTLRGAALGIGARDLGGACELAEAADDMTAAARIDRVVTALDGALADVAAWRHELMLRGLKG